MKPKSCILILYHIGINKEKYINVIATRFVELAGRVGGSVVLGLIVFHKLIINLDWQMSSQFCSQMCNPTKFSFFAYKVAISDALTTLCLGVVRSCKPNFETHISHNHSIVSINVF